MKKTYYSSGTYYKPYIYKGLKGRYLHMPAVNKEAKRTFVLLYGQHATLERIEPIIGALTEFGDVYAVDNPGFGGMESAYKIGEYPSLKFYAGHLKYFLDTVVPEDRSVTLLGVSFGFQIITETLKEYPKLLPRIEQAISFVGFVSHADFHLPLSYKLPLIDFIGNISKSWFGSKVVELFLHDWIITSIYRLSKPIQAKVKTMKSSEVKKYASEQAWLWRVNDIRTHSVTAIDFIKRNDLTGYRINVSALHVGVPKDHLLDNGLVVKELAEIYKPFENYNLHLANHAPLDLDSREKVLDLLPEELRSKLKVSRNMKAVL